MTFDICREAFSVSENRGAFEPRLLPALLPQEFGGFRKRSVRNTGRCSIPSTDQPIIGVNKPIRKCCEVSKRRNGREVEATDEQKVLESRYVSHVYFASS